MRRVAVVGGGPAGTAAAKTAAACGVEVVLIEAEPELGDRWRDDRGLPEGVEHLVGSEAWAIEPVAGGHRVHVRTGAAGGPERTGRAVEARALVLATGAHDRVLPFPGWDLPGIHTTQAVLAGTAGIAAGERVIVAGTGPFLPPAATTLLEAGARVTAVLEAGDPVAAFLARPAGVLADRTGAGELARHTTALAGRDVPISRRSAVMAARGRDRLTAVLAARLDERWAPVPRSVRRFEVDALVVGFGRTPCLDLAVAAGCAIEDGFVAVNAAQATSVAGVFAAGELTGIGGAAAAEGAVAGAAAAKLLGARVRAPIRRLRRARAGRRFAAALAEAYPIGPGWRGWLSEETPVCPCEGVSYGELRRALPEPDEGVSPQLTLATGAGLGWCRGRRCGRNIAELVGEAEDLGGGGLAAPVPLGELAEER